MNTQYAVVVMYQGKKAILYQGTDEQRARGLKEAYTAKNAGAVAYMVKMTSELILME